MMMRGRGEAELAHGHQRAPRHLPRRLQDPGRVPPPGARGQAGRVRPLAGRRGAGDRRVPRHRRGRRPRRSGRRARAWSGWRARSSAGARAYIDLPCRPDRSRRRWPRSPRELRARAGVPDIVVSNAGGFLLRPLEQTDGRRVRRAARGQPAGAVRAGAGASARACAAARPGQLHHRRQRGRPRGLSRERRLRRQQVRAPRAARDAARRVSRHRRPAHPGLSRADRHRDLGPVRSRPPRRVSRPGPRCSGPADVADAVLFVATRPPHVLIDWLRLGPV